MKKSLRIKGLDPTSEFRDVARLVLKDRLRRVNRIAKRYLASHDEEDLHQLRIAFRRLRYPMECFVDCFPRRLYDTVLDRIDFLQNATGQVRDLDVVLDMLKTRQSRQPAVVPVGSPGAGESDEPGDGELVEPVPAPVDAMHESIIALEAERRKRNEALDGALSKILASGAFRKFRRELNK